MIQSLEKLRDKLKLALKYQKKKNKKGGHALFNQSLKTKYVIKTIRMYTYFIINGLRNKRNHYRKLFKRSQLSINKVKRKQKKQLKQRKVVHFKKVYKKGINRYGVVRNNKQVIKKIYKPIKPLALRARKYILSQYKKYAKRKRNISKIGINSTSKIRKIKDFNLLLKKLPIKKVISYKKQIVKSNTIHRKNLKPSIYSERRNVKLQKKLSYIKTKTLTKKTSKLIKPVIN